MMRNAAAFVIAIHVTLVASAVLLVSCAMLGLHELRKLQAASADTGRAYALLLGTTTSAIELARGTKVDFQSLSLHADPDGGACFNGSTKLAPRSPMRRTTSFGGALDTRLGSDCELQTMPVEKPASIDLSATMTEPAGDAPAVSTFGHATPAPPDLMALVDSAAQQQAIAIKRGNTASTESLHRLERIALLVGIGAVAAVMLLFVLVRSGFAAARGAFARIAVAKNELEAVVGERTAQLQHANDALRRYAARVEEIREEERVRIARDVHDGLGSMLTALKIELSGSLGSAGRDGARRPWVRRASTEMVDAAMQSLRDLVRSLHPYPLERLGLYDALRWKVTAFERTTGIGCSLSIDDGLPAPRYPASIAAFRIVEEALTNVARHAKAKTVVIAVYPADGLLVIEVRDDGCGIAWTDGMPDTTFGLLNMRERARLAGGELDISSGGGVGTTVRLTLAAWETTPCADSRS